jgi:phenylpyruvate tautomerase PptA (4-oxalocrotonate tautomerase family)
MPVAVIDVPQGLGKEAKNRLHKEVFEAMHEAWLIPDTRVFLREFDPEQTTSTDGVLGAPVRPVVGYEGPPLPVEVKQRLAGRVWKAIAEAYKLPRETLSLPSGKTISTQWVLQLFREYPGEQAALDDLMAFENPAVTEAMEQVLKATAGKQGGH